VTLQPKQVLEVEIPVSASPNLGLTFVAAPTVSATLIDAAGAVAGQSPANMKDANAAFRSIFVERPVVAGTWKLKVENTGTLESFVAIAAWADANPVQISVTAGRLDARGQAPVQVKVINNGSPAMNATVTGKVFGVEGVIEFFDDGKHGDGTANDGVYGASIDKLKKGEYAAEVTVKSNGQTMTTIAPISSR
jgi:hypothetical protein